MEAEFEQMWLQMADHERHSDVYNEILAHLKPPPATPTSETTGRTKSPLCAHALTGASLEYLAVQLVRNTYPTLPITRLLTAGTGVTVAWRAVQHSCELMQKTPTSLAIAQRLVVVLVHIDWPDDKLAQIRRTAFPVLDALLDQTNADGAHDDAAASLTRFWLCWLSQPYSLVLLDFLEHMQHASRHRARTFSLAHAFQQATGAPQTHFIADALSSDTADEQVDQLLPPASVRLRAAVGAVRQLNSMQTDPIDETALQRLGEAVELFTNGDGLTRTVLLELCRLCTLQQKLYYHVANLDVTALCGQFNVLDYMSGSLSLNQFDCDRAQAILLANRTANRAILRLSDADGADEAASTTVTEIDVYEQFIVVRRLVDAINNRSGEGAQIAALTQCKRALRTIRSLAAFAECVEACVALLFLRWDHVTHMPNLDRTVESGSESSETPPTAPLVSDGVVALPATALPAAAGRNRRHQRHRHERYGFICGADCLAAILRMLRWVITQRSHTYETEGTMQRLAPVTAVIADGIWRLSLFRTMEQTTTVAAVATESSAASATAIGVVIDAKRFLHEHRPVTASRQNTITSTSSSDELDTENGRCRGGEATIGLPDVVAGGDDVGKRKRRPTTTAAGRRINHTLLRRKPRKDRPFRKLASGERSMSFSHSTENERRRSTGGGAPYDRRLPGVDDSGGELAVDPMECHNGWDGRRSLISKMLGSTEHLVMVCMNRGDLKSTRQMIKNHSLERSSLAAELTFTESFNQTKEKLRPIFERLRLLHTAAADADVETSAPTAATADRSSLGRPSSPATTVDRIKRAAAIGLEISTITNTIARFATGTPVHLIDATETHRVLHKYREKLPFLGLYQPGESLQATIVCDLLLSLATDVDIAANVFEVLQKLWPSTRGDDGDHTTSESRSITKRGIGYMAFVHSAVDAMRQLQPNRQQQQLSMRSLLSDEFLVIDQTELADWLAREQTFELLRALDADAVNQPSVLNGLQLAFKRVRTPQPHRQQRKATSKQPTVVHLFERVNEFLQGTWRLMRFASLERRQMTSTEILQFDLYESVGTMVLEQNCSPDDLEGLLCGMNMNLVHVLAVALVSPISGVRVPTTMKSAEVELLLKRLDSTVQTHVLDTRKGGPPELRRQVNGIVWSYLCKHNPILSAVLQRMCGLEAEFVDTLDQLVNLSEMEHVSRMHDNNTWTAAMVYDFTTVEDVYRMLQTTTDYGSVLQVLRSIKPLHRRAHLKSTLLIQDWLIQRYLSQPIHDTATGGDIPYQLIDHIANIHQRADCLLKHLKRITDAQLAVRLIRSLLLHDNASNLLASQRSELQLWLRNVLVYDRCTELFAAAAGSDLYQPIVRNWLQLKQLSELRLARIVEVLFDADEFALCLQWSAIHPIGPAAGRSRETLSELVVIINRTIARQCSVDADLFALVESLPRPIVLQIYQALLTSVHNVPVLRYLIDSFMREPESRDDSSSDAGVISDEQRVHTHRVNVSLRIIELSASDELNADTPPWHLITTPLLIIEQYVMNARFDALTHIVAGLRPLLDASPTCQFCHRHYRDVATCLDRRSSDDDNVTARSSSSASGRVFNLSSRTFSDSVCDEFVLLHNDFAQRSEHTLATDCVDALLRIYASKALDFRVIETQRLRRPSDQQSPVARDDDDVECVDDRRSQATDATPVSTDSLANVGGDSDTPFCMPHTPPVREMWTRDEDASHCMCCTRAVFTMLTRRHHCRQCGRVVCHACSTQRELIAVLYADVPVRVCDDCQRQLTVERLRATYLTSTSGGGCAGVMSRSNSSASPRPGLTRLATTSSTPPAGNETSYWQFSGNLRHDELLRDEFSYEFAPSVSLCLSILALHSAAGPQCADFLLMHCGRFEALLRPLQPDYPNPEVDYALVTRMLHCLALAAKVRGGTAECDVVLEHADIIRAVVQHRCEELLPMEPLGRNSFRKLRDALLLAEKWELALEVSLKRGFSTTGVMAAWGIACLKSGCFETAREKFAHCMSKPTATTDDDLFRIFACISYESQFSRTVPEDLPQIKRPEKSPPLLAKIVSILEATCHTTQPDVMVRAAIIRHSNASLLTSNPTGNATNIGTSSWLPRRGKPGDVPCHEPAMNILHTLANLRHIVAGTHESSDGIASSPNTSSTSSGQDIHTSSATGLLSTSIGSIRSLTPAGTTPPPTIDQKRLTPTSRFYDECLYYLNAYASHNDIVVFLERHRQTRTALKYIHYQSVDVGPFVHTLFMPHVQRGRAAAVVRHMCDMDETLLIWRKHIIAVCGHLERAGLLNSLYMLQLLFRDPVRASMTCVRFYERGATSYTDLQSQAFHLVTAERHLTKELDLCQWEEIRRVGTESTTDVQQRTGRQRSMASDTVEPRSVRMKWDSRTLNSHIGTIGRQLEITKFLANCELAGRELPRIGLQSARLPTLFGGAKDRIQLAVLVLICGANVTEGFGLVYRIIHDCRLNAEAVYTAAAGYLARQQRLAGVEQLLECLHSNVAGSTVAAAVASEQRLCDRIVAVAVEAMCGNLTGGDWDGRRNGSRQPVQAGADANNGTPTTVGLAHVERELFDRLVRQVGDVGMRISCHIAGGQLKSAYLLAVQHSRMADIRRVMRRAEATNQPMIKRLCEMKLRMME